MKRLLAVLLTLGGALAYCGDIPVNTGGPTAWTSNAGTAVACYNNTGQSSAYFTQTGSTGPTDAQVSNDGSHWTAAVITDASGTTHSQPFTPTAGTTYRVTPAGLRYVEVLPDVTWGAQSASTNIRCTSASDPLGGNVTAVVSSLPPFVCASPNCVVNTPAPAPTDTTNSAIRVAQANTPTPAPTFSPGGQIMYTQVGPSPGAQGGFSGASAGSNYAAVDSNGHQAVNICSATSAPCVTLTTGSSSVLLTGTIGMTKTELSATVTTCTQLSASAAVIMVGVMFPTGTAQTGTLDIYDETGTGCATVPYYESKARPSTASQGLDPIGFKVGTGVSYKWTTNAEVGHVFLLTI